MLGVVTLHQKITTTSFRKQPGGAFQKGVGVSIGQASVCGVQPTQHRGAGHDQRSIDKASMLNCFGSEWMSIPVKSGSIGSSETGGEEDVLHELMDRYNNIIPVSL